MNDNFHLPILNHLFVFLFSTCGTLFGLAMGMKLQHQWLTRPSLGFDVQFGTHLMGGRWLLLSAFAGVVCAYCFYRGLEGLK